MGQVVGECQPPRLVRGLLKKAVPASLTIAALLAFAPSVEANAPPGRGSRPVQVARPLVEPPSDISETILLVGFAKIAELYIQQVNFGQLTMDGLKGLTNIDPSIRSERNDESLRILYSGQTVAEFLPPGPRDSAGWAVLLTRAVERARTHSAPLAQANPERIYQLVFDGVTSGLDGYSRYTSAQRATNERAQRDGYGGVGLSLDSVNGRTTIREVLPRGPADRAGLKPGDQLLAIDGDLVVKLNDTDMRDRLRGATGTLVTVTIARDGGQPRRVPVRRERVIPNTVSQQFSDGVGVIKIDRFNATTAANLRDAVIAVRNGTGSSLRGIILDLRGNPGGLLDQAVSVADLFIPTGPIITTDGRHPESRQRFDAVADDIGYGTPMVVLVDGRSASSAEVVAAALQDSGRAVVVGASSYGKGSVQTVIRLPNDGELFLTWSRIYSPAGYTLHRQGVHPTVCTSRQGVDNPTTLLNELRTGRGRPASQIASWRAKAGDDEEALLRLRETCPWKEHEPDLDLRVAQQLLTEPGLYQRAITLALASAVAER